MSSFHVVAQIRARDAASADRVEKLLGAIRDLALSDKEPGTSKYFTNRGRDDPLEFAIYEEYASQDAMNAHMAAAPFQALVAEAEQLFDGGKAGLKIGYYNAF